MYLFHVFIAGYEMDCYCSVEEIIIGDFFKEEINENRKITVTVELVEPLVTQRLCSNLCVC